MNYWERRQQELNKAMEKDEEKLKKRLSSYFDTEYRKLEKQIAAYYKQYGTDNVIQYRRLMESLPDADKRLLMEQMDEFEKKYPQYAHLMPIRESIYTLNRLEGLQYSVRMQQLEIGAVENEQITEHLNRQAMRGANVAAETMGFGKNFYSNNPDITKLFVNVPWSNGENFSQKIWNNTAKLANYLNSDIAQGIARGDSYDRLVRRLRERFSNVSRNDAYRLIYTEGTYVMAESTIQPFTEDFEKYRLSTVGDGKVCAICRGVSEEIFDIADRQPGVNFPPLHPWCRCTFTIEVDDWDAWMEDYEKRHGNGEAQKVATRLGGENGMNLQLPGNVHKIKGMTPKNKKEIEDAIRNLQSEYDIQLDEIETARLGRGTIFSAVPYVDNGAVKFALVLNEDIDYTKVKKNINIRYKKGRFAGRSIEDYIAHEMAHIMTYQDCVTEADYRTKKRIIQRQYIPGISGYADQTQDGAESLAEAFVRFRNGEKISINAEILVRTYIERWKK